MMIPAAPDTIISGPPRARQGSALYWAASTSLITAFITSSSILPLERQ